MAYPKQEPSAADRRRVEAALDSIQVADQRARDARARYAALVKEVGFTKAAKVEGVDKQIVFGRWKNWGESRSGREVTSAAKPRARSASRSKAERKTQRRRSE